MQIWSGDVAKYRGIKGGIGAILHVVIKAVKVGPCEGGSESAVPARPNQHLPLIIHDVCVCAIECVYKHMCLSSHC